MASPAFARWVQAIEIAGPGFLNVRLKPHATQQVVREIFDAGNAFGHSAPTGEKKVLVEFVSANPTGHCMWAMAGRPRLAMPSATCWLRRVSVCGASSITTMQGCKSRRSPPACNCARVASPRATPNGRAAKRQRSTTANTSRRSPPISRRKKPSPPTTGLSPPAVISTIWTPCGSSPWLTCGTNRIWIFKRFGVRFDHYYLESSLYSSGRVAAAVEKIVAAGKTYEQDGALWLKSTDYGDDKDRVMQKSDGSFTYFVPDVAYHLAKWERGYHRAVNIQGTDHHGTIARVRAGLQAAGDGVAPGYPNYVLHTMVRVMKGGVESQDQQARRQLCHAARPDRMDQRRRGALFSAVAQTRYRIHLRCRFGGAEEQRQPGLLRAVRTCPDLFGAGGLGRRSRRSGCRRSVGARYGTGARLAAAAARYPQMLADAARDFAPHDVTFYLRELASSYHSYYDAERILVDELPVRQARLALVAATAQVLQNGLALLGVSAPARM